MAGIENALFMVSVIAFVIAIFMQFYNVMSGGKTYDIKISFLVFCASILTLGISFAVTLEDPETVIYSSILYYMQGLFILSFLFLFIEILFYISGDALVGSGVKK